MSITDHNNIPEEGESVLRINERDVMPLPERHGFVKWWLIFTLVMCFICILVYLLLMGTLQEKLRMSSFEFILVITLLVLDIVFVFKLLRWRIIGFYGVIGTTIVGFILNICLKVPIIACLLGLLGPVVLFGILQIKRNGFSAWHYLKQQQKAE